MTDVLLLVVAVLLSLVCGVFVAAEFSLTTVERSELEDAVERRVRGARSALRAVRHLTFQLSGAQLGITVTNLIVGMLAQLSLAKLIRGPLQDLGASHATASSTALVLGTALSTVFLMVVGELVPKNWAISAPLAVARRVAAPQLWFSTAFRPFIGHLNATANRAVRHLGLEPAQELASARGPQELIALAEHSARKGALEADTAELFVRTLNLAELTAENVMTPRVRVIALDAQATCEDVANATRATGLSRFPVCHDNLDTVIGVVHIKDVLSLPAARRPDTPVTGLMRKGLLVPETLTVDRLLNQLSSRNTLVVVVDEYGGTAGVVTLEDIVEEVVGQVTDEHDPHKAPDLVRSGRDPEGRVLYAADGAARTDRLEQIGLRAPEGPYETLAGLIATCLGRIPEAGDSVDVAGWRLDVVDAAGHRAARVLLHAPLAHAGGPAGHGRSTGRFGDGGPGGEGRGRAGGGPGGRRGGAYDYYGGAGGASRARGDRDGGSGGGQGGGPDGGSSAAGGAEDGP